MIEFGIDSGGAMFVKLENLPLAVKMSLFVKYSLM